MSVNTVDEAWDYLIETGLASEQTLQVVTCINGYSLDTLESVLYALTGYRSFDHTDEDVDEDNEDDVPEMELKVPYIEPKNNKSEREVA